MVIPGLLFISCPQLVRLVQFTSPVCEINYAKGNKDKTAVTIVTKIKEVTRVTKVTEVTWITNVNDVTAVTIVKK